MEIDHNELNIIAKKSFEIKQPLMIWGRTGIGKSMAVKKIFKEVAGENKRVFKEWCMISEVEKRQKKLQVT